MKPISRAPCWLLTAVTAAACHGAPVSGDAVSPDGPEVDAPAPDGLVVTPLVDAPGAPPDALPPDDAPRPLDAAPPDGPPAPSLPPLALDPSFSGDGGFLFGTGFAGPVATSGRRIETCGTTTHWYDDITYVDATWGFRTTPGAAEDVLAVWPFPPGSYPAPRCTATALHPDGTSVATYTRNTAVGLTDFLFQRGTDGTYHGVLPSPTSADVVRMHALAGDQIALVVDDAVWLLDAALAPVPAFGAGGRLAVPGVARFSVMPHTAAPRIDVVTTTSLVRVDPATGALDPSFGVGGVVALPPVATYGVAPLPDGGELIVGAGQSFEVSPTGALTPVTLPPIHPSVVIEDRAGGAYLISAASTYAIEFVVTRVAPIAPGVWGDGGAQAVSPPEMCPVFSTPSCRDWFEVVDAAWTSDGKLAVSLQRNGNLLGEFYVSHNAQLVVLTR